ncbi:MAG: pantetheine-phosphate adenylyltransferase [Clostridia bacterium]|nr:pantetheine-phosphate adenylyltransferase [Clostridia bacterium]
MNRRALIAGSFDPITIGHYDIIERASALFDELYVVVFDNGVKRYMFKAEERADMIQRSCSDLKNVTVDISHSLLADYVNEHNIDVIVKGVRNSTDYDYEHQLYLINYSLCGVETVLLPAKGGLGHISSTMVRDLIAHGKDVSGFMPGKLR